MWQLKCTQVEAMYASKYSKESGKRHSVVHREQHAERGHGSILNVKCNQNICIYE